MFLINSLHTIYGWRKFENPRQNDAILRFASVISFFLPPPSSYSSILCVGAIPTHTQLTFQAVKVLENKLIYVSQVSANYEYVPLLFHLSTYVIYSHSLAIEYPESASKTY
jgi:hypothetical protein